MVRFDSKVLLGGLRKQPLLSDSAFSTIKYLCKAGARVILVSSWDETCNLKIITVDSVAGKMILLI